MKEILINVSKETRMVDLQKNIIGNDGENLQGKLIFTFVDAFVNGQARLEYEIKGKKNYIVLNKENETYTIPIKNVITKEGQIDMQLVITEGTDEEEIPVFKSNKFYLFCNSSINAVDEAPKGYELWIEQANVKLNEIDNLDIDLQDNILTITKKDGTTKSENVKGEKGEKGDAGSVKFIIVNELPTEDIDESAIYMKPSTNPEEQNTYDEYIYVNGDWESLGSAKVEVDLTDYVKNTDYADNSKFGVVKTNNNYGIQTENGVLYIRRATEPEIKTRHQWAPITPNNLDLALKIAMCDGVGEAWTDEEKLKAQERIGVSKIPSGMTLTADVVLEESVARVSFNEIVVKNYEKLIIYIFQPATAFSSGNGSISFNSSVGGGLGSTVYNAFSTNQKINVRHTMVKTDGSNFETTCEWVNAGTNINDTAFIQSLYKSDANPYSGYLTISTTQTFPIGTHILIYTK